MLRLTTALAVWIVLGSVASATLTPRKERLLRDPAPLSPPASYVARETPAASAGPATASEFSVNKRTEILLDGKPCRYEDVPEQASIQRMEVAPDRKTVLRIHFRTAK